MTKSSFLNKYKFWVQNFDAMVTRFNTKSVAEKYSSANIATITGEIARDIKDQLHYDTVLFVL